MRHNYRALRAETLSITARYLELATLLAGDDPIIAYQLRELVECGQKVIKSTDFRIADLTAVSGETQ